MADVEFTVEGHIAQVRLNRPQALNAITREMDDVLFAAWAEINADPEIWAAILSAEGEKGFCIGGGFELAMCADIIVAADTAQFGLPETKVGIIGECGVVQRAIRQLPYHIVMQLILTGERITAADARHYGLVNEVVPYDKLAEAVLAWAGKLNAASPLAVQAAKAAALGRLGHPLDFALMTRFEPIEEYARTQDKKEGERAARERRKPVWSGR